jgi:hypothetical protein
MEHEEINEFMENGGFTSNLAIPSPYMTFCQNSRKSSMANNYNN